MLVLVRAVSISTLCVCRENEHDHDVETEQNKVFQHLVLFLQDIFDKREADIAIFCPAERQLDESNLANRRDHQNSCSVYPVALETNACQYRRTRT